jgi:hypothetical protein
MEDSEGNHGTYIKWLNSGYLSLGGHVEIEGKSPTTTFLGIQPNGVSKDDEEFNVVAPYINLTGSPGDGSANSGSETVTVLSPLIKIEGGPSVGTPSGSETITIQAPFINIEAEEPTTGTTSSSYQVNLRAGQVQILAASSSLPLTLASGYGIVRLSDLQAFATIFNNHVHSGVSTGTGDTDIPTVGVSPTASSVGYTQ